MAEVAVARTTACGGNCPSCESCIYQSEIKTLARNRIEARPGQRVVIATQSGAIFGAALLGAKEGLCILASFLALLVSAAILVLSQRSKKNRDKIQFDIVRFAEEV